VQIGRHKIKHNKKIPLSVEEYIFERIKTLGILVKEKLGHGCLVTVTKSHRSEACYIVIENKITWDNITISFRNHHYFKTPKDYTVYLSQFDTWPDAMNYFLDEILPVISEIMK
jgi:hypothetical protein